MAAHLAALAYLRHSGPADEHAALYAALFGFLEDPSVKVRASMAYGLLHAREAPRPIMLALLHDSPIIARAVLQYSPVLVDADILPLVAGFDEAMLLSAAERGEVSRRLAEALLARGVRPVTLRIFERADVPIGAPTLKRLAHEMGEDARVRAVLLARADLPADARLLLVRNVVTALRGLRIVSGAIARGRLERLLRNALDTAVTRIGEREAGEGACAYAEELATQDQLSTRTLLHALVNGHVLFFAACCSELGDVPRAKVFSILEHGSRAALNALLARCGLAEGVRNLLARLIAHARSVDLADDIAARHFVVTALTEELIAEHEGDIPDDLAEAFAYLCEQNVLLARRAAQGVMAAFAAEASTHLQIGPEERLALPAA
ncbi:DUF2336 domain-containing protein [Devosia nitrariae]|uniref:DUF2336 domain-containing protein n=1 Tax=Devosia nitrariae TaxID=2071872 RepID=A0ABQ5WBW5_9HYPH|nr:DUF2336 domain-containing protein [Devosia nitrariae]GLQ57594.1 hypothetical protein GCM10010862_48530 [Devosia nitrariae]